MEKPEEKPTEFTGILRKLPEYLQIHRLYRPTENRKKTVFLLIFIMFFP